MIKDPTDGGPAPDRFLAITADTVGDPVEPFVLLSFLSLMCVNTLMIII